MFFRMRAEFVEFILQFDNGLFEVEPMFHTLWRIRFGGRSINS